MAPPSYVDLGKLARSIINNAYHFGIWKLTCYSRTTSGIDFNTVGYSAQDTGKVFGALESKYTMTDQGINFMEKWNTNNELYSEVSIQDKLAEGLKLGVSNLFSTESGNKEGKFFGAYAHENFKFDFNANIDLNGPLVNASIVLGYQQLLGGYQTAFDTQNMSLTTNNFALGYATPELVLHAEFKDAKELVGSIFHKCTENLDAALMLNYASEGENNAFTVGGVYQLEGDAKVRAKVNTDGQIGLGYQQKVRDGVTMFVSALIEGKDLSAGAHKIGVALELSA